ncbi:thiol-disulfide oxidoreductase DCC family protein [Metabacillus indicus]|uniref:thiol-disulfide oxidoreductase DCC family protein n=1 Tax=Metabacillus indicus TaxID=246786 RepID=UPI002A084029|nr:thiol-disulfide oxidoreductase DCC family protein [Metabacillus indicus]MDX8290279.1 thiol-disulfide oxidoreductase DCC family protein [Metabacillus indicus]
MTHNKILLFDGVCNFCDGTVQFVLKHDKKEAFSFASLQSEAGQSLLRKHGLPLEDYDSFVYLEEGKVHTKSTAALRVLKELGGMYKALYLLIAVPKPTRDAVYMMIAKNRYKWFGKKDACTLPSKDVRKRFL